MKKILLAFIFIFLGINTPIVLATPSAITGFTATAVSSSQIVLSWNQSTGPDTPFTYYIFRCSGVCTPSTGFGSQIATTLSLTYSDTGLNPSSTYSYKVRAVDTVGTASVPSSTVAATTITMSWKYRHLYGVGRLIRGAIIIY